MESIWENPEKKVRKEELGEAGESVGRHIYSILWEQASKLARSAQIVVI
jgi:hypothetical protein